MSQKSKVTLHTLCLALLAMVLLLSACAPAAIAAQPTSAPSAAPTSIPTADPKAGWPAKFVLGFFSGDDPNKVLNNNEPFRAYLEKKLGIKVELITGTSYTAVIEAMRVNKADAMEVGPFSYTLAVQEANAEALAVGVSTNAKPAVYDAKLAPYYYSTIFTKKGSGITKISDLKGKDFTFVDPASTSGHLMPKSLLIKNGLNPDKDMKTVFAGSHPSSVMAVANGKVPAGATYEGNLLDLRTSGQIQFCYFADGIENKARTPEEFKAMYDACPDGNLVMLTYTDPIPNTPFAIRSNMPASFKAAVKEALLDVKNQPELITNITRWYVDPSKELNLKNLDAFYNPLRDVAKLLNLDLKAMK